MKLLGWFILIGMVAGTIATIIDQPVVIPILAFIGWLLRGFRWSDR